VCVRVGGFSLAKSHTRKDTIPLQHCNTEEIQTSDVCVLRECVCVRVWGGGSNVTLPRKDGPDASTWEN